MTPSPDPPRFASRGGLKLDAALDHFGVDVAGAACADLGCSTGGFVDCLLQRGAARVFAVDTAYGELAWKLRQDPRVAVLERTNALHVDPPAEAAQACGVVTLDLGWTKQAKAIPAALRWLSNTAEGRMVTLVKPHYESGRHRLTDEEADGETRRVVEEVLPSLGVEVLGWMRSPIRGGKGKNLEHLTLLRREHTTFSG
ncbi:MAG: SAM-dependent methyltransferase [Planctomycetota bacterium]